jgi:hypothetical protein
MWKANKFVNTLLWVLAGISVILCAYVFIKCVGMDESTQKEEMLSVVNPVFVWMYVLIGITALLSILLPIPYVIENPKSGKGILVGIVGFVIVVGISYALGKTDALPFTPGHDPVSEGTLKFADVNLFSMYLMIAGTILSLLVSGIFGFTKTK